VAQGWERYRKEPERDGEEEAPRRVPTPGKRTRTHSQSGTRMEIPFPGKSPATIAIHDWGFEPDPGVRAQVEQVTGADLSDVRVHTGAPSQETAAALSAKAFTVGQNIFFASGQYQPSTGPGAELLAHELVHTVQQGAGPTAAQLKSEAISQRGDAAEVEADRIAGAALSGAAIQIAPVQQAAAIARDDEPTGPMTVVVNLVFRGDTVAHGLNVTDDKTKTWVAPQQADVEKKMSESLGHILSPGGKPLHETKEFLNSSAIGDKLLQDLKTSATNNKLELTTTAEFLNARKTAYTEGKLLKGLEDYLEGEGQKVPIDWPAVAPALKEYKPFEPANIIDASDLDRYRFFIDVVAGEAAGRTIPTGSATPAAATLGPLINTYVFDVMTAEDWGAIHGWHSEKFLSDWMAQLTEIEYVPDGFNVESFAPKDTAAAVDKERDRLLDDFIANHAKETVAMFILDEMTRSGQKPEEFLAGLDMGAMKDKVLDNLTAKFVKEAKKDPAFKAALRDHALEQSRYTVLFLLHGSASSQPDRNAELEGRFLEVSDWAELTPFEASVARDPFDFVTREKALARVMTDFFNNVSAGKTVEAATVELAQGALAAIGDTSTYPGTFLLPQALAYLAQLKKGFDDQEAAARQKLRDKALPAYDDIVKTVKDAAKTADTFIKEKWIPELKKIARSRLKKNKEDLEAAHKNWDTHKSSSITQYKMAAAMFEDLAGQLESGAVDIIELDGQMLDKSRAGDLRNCAKVLSANARKLESKKGSEDEKKKIQEAIDGYAKVEKGVEEENPYKPFHYGSSVKDEALTNLGIGKFADPEFTTYGMVLKGEAVASENPFLARAITAWEFKEITTEQGNKVALFIAAGMLTLASMIVPGAAGLVLFGLDLAVGVGMATKNLLDAQAVQKMARIDTDLSVYGVSEEQADKAVKDAWTGLALTVVLAVGVAAFMARAILRGGTGAAVKGFPHLEAVLKADANLARELTALCKDVRTLERILSNVKAYGHAKELLLIADSAKVESLLTKVGGDSASLVRVLKAAGQVKSAEKLLETISDAAKLADILEEVGDAKKLQGLLDTLGAEKTTEIINSLGAQRFGGLAAELDAKALSKFVAEVDLARIQGLESSLALGARDIARVHASAGVDGLAQIERVQALESAGRVHGLSDWASFLRTQKGGSVGSKTVRGDISNAILELRTVEKLAGEHPDSLIRFGGDLHAPPDPKPFRPGDKLPSFDITIEPKGGGAVAQSVEVTQAEGAVSKAPHLTGGLQHATAKVAKRAANGEPIPGKLTVEIYVDLARGEKTKAGTITVLDAEEAAARGKKNGDVILTAGNGKEIPQGNLFDSVPGHLPKVKDNALVDRIVVRERNSGTPLATYTRSGTAWSGP
jgi:hypothetical protein